MQGHAARHRGEQLDRLVSGRRRRSSSSRWPRFVNLRDPLAVLLRDRAGHRPRRGVDHSCTARPRARSRAPAAKSAHRPTVSVIIPAYNEERVIEDSLRRVLASDLSGDLQVIVADDGSKDRDQRAGALSTYAIEPRVLRLADHGERRQGQCAQPRAGSRQRARSSSHSTRTPSSCEDTISKLVRWFEDPADRRGRRQRAGRQQASTWSPAGKRSNTSPRRTSSAGRSTALRRNHRRSPARSARGGARRSMRSGGYPEDTLAEDQDLTIAIQRLGLAGRLRCRGDRADRSAGDLSPRWASSATAGRSARCSACGSTASVLSTGNGRAGSHGSACRRPGCSRSSSPRFSPMIDLALIVSIVGTVLRVQQHGWDADPKRRTAPRPLLGRLRQRSTSSPVWIAYRLEPDPPAHFPGALHDAGPTLRLSPADVRRRPALDPLGAAGAGGRLGQTRAQR